MLYQVKGIIIKNGKEYTKEVYTKATDKLEAIQQVEKDLGASLRSFSVIEVAREQKPATKPTSKPTQKQEPKKGQVVEVELRGRKVHAKVEIKEFGKSVIGGTVQRLGNNSKPLIFLWAMGSTKSGGYGRPYIKNIGYNPHTMGAEVKEAAAFVARAIAKVKKDPLFTKDTEEDLRKHAENKSPKPKAPKSTVKWDEYY